MLLITFVELRMVAGRSRMWAGHPHAVSGLPMLAHTCHAHAVLCRGLEKLLAEWHGRGMAGVNQTWPHRVHLMGKTQSKPLAARHSRKQHGNGMVCVK
jgi:hypothetical protein